MRESTERRWGLSVAAWAAVALGVYGVLAAASLLGIVAGAFAGGFGALLAVAVLTDDPPRRTLRVAKAGLILSALALAVCAIWVVAIVMSER